MDREFSFAELCQLLGLDQATARNWMRMGLLVSCREEGRAGRGKVHYFAIGSLMAGAMARTLRQRGATLAYIVPVAEYLCGLSAEEIEQAAADDLVLVAAGNLIAPSLRRRDEVARNDSGFVELILAAPMADLFARVRAGIELVDRASATACN